MITNQPLQNQPIVPRVPVGGTGPLGAAEAAQAGVGVAAAENGGMKVDVNLKAAPGANLAAIDMVPVLKAGITALIPGASFFGAWTDAMLTNLQAAVEKVPVALRNALNGTAFKLSEDPKEVPADAQAATTNDPRVVAIRPSAFALPADANGVPSVQQLLMHEFGHAVDADPLHTQAFAKLSDWKETLFDAKGKIIGEPRDANGVDRSGGWADGDTTYADGTRMAYSHAADAHFVGDGEDALDPRDDYAESFRVYVFSPKELLAKAPEKFLSINAEAHSYPADQVKAWAAEAGVDLNKVVGDMAAKGRAYQSTVDAIAGNLPDLHGNIPQVADLDTAVLGGTTGIKGIEEMVANSVKAHGTGTAADIAKAQTISADYAKLKAKDPNAYEVGEKRNDFMRLPMDVQLKVDPELALGDTWSNLTQAERNQLLADPKNATKHTGNAAAVDAMVAKAKALPNAAAVDAATAARDASFDKFMDAMFDPGRDAYLLRTQLKALDPSTNIAAQQQKLAASLTKIGIPAAQQAYFLDKANWKTMGKIAGDKDVVDTIFTYKQGAVGYTQVKAAIEKTRAENGKGITSLDQVLTQYKAAIQQSKTVVQADVHAGLDSVMSTVMRQSQAGNQAFKDTFINGVDPNQTNKDPEYVFSNLFGAAQWNKLTAAEKTAIKSDKGLRERIVENAGKGLASGAAIAQDVRLYQTQTHAMQTFFSALFDPANKTFRDAMAADPVAALKKLGVWDDLPKDVQKRASDPAQRAQLTTLVKTVAAGVAGASASEAAKLAQYAKMVNASNYEVLFNVLDQSTEGMVAAVSQEVAAARDHGILRPDFVSTAS